MGIALSVGLPLPREGGDPVVRAVIAERHQIRVHLLDRATLLARAAGVDPEPACQLLGKRVQLAGALGHLELRFNRAGSQVLADRVAGQDGAPSDLPDRYPFPEMSAADHTQ